MGKSFNLNFVQLFENSIDKSVAKQYTYDSTVGKIYMKIYLWKAVLTVVFREAAISKIVNLVHNKSIKEKLKNVNGRYHAEEMQKYAKLKRLGCNLPTCHL